MFTRLVHLSLAAHGTIAFAQGTPPNLLLVIADDVGVYELASYGEGSDPAVTPTLDALAQDGVLFRNCWANPLCSPTRATIQTGRYSIQTGMGALLTASFGLPLTEVTVAEGLDILDSGYSSAFFGKWHLSNLKPETGALLAPNLSGYDHAVWTIQNLVAPEDYFQWSEIENGVEFPRTGYITSSTVDRALEWVATAPRPWFVVLSFHAAHDPMHTPPAGLHTTDTSRASAANQRPYFKAMIESIDHELQRFLDGLGTSRAATNVVFVGDNGSPPTTIGPPGQSDKAKGSVFEGGIRVPLLVQGPSVPAAGATCAALVNTTDLFATLIELTGKKIPPAAYVALELSTVSIVPYLTHPDLESLRTFAYAERFAPSGFAASIYLGAAREERYKLHLYAPPVHLALYDLECDPLEEQDLLLAPLDPEAEGALTSLKALIISHVAAYGD
jgi:arylsulfatase A-like enzyme